MPEPARLLDDVAASIADGAPVDWAHPVAEMPERDQRLLRHLRLIESLASVYRTLPADPGDDPTGEPSSDPEPAGPRWGRLILLDRIGRGASADVFRAWDTELQREVALKLLHIDGDSNVTANARMLQEARRLARVRHPHVVHVYGAERHEERIGLWMELVRGRTLDEIVRVEGPIGYDEAAGIVGDLCGAVAAVHAAGLLHRDIKAQNAIRDESGRVVIMDFGTGEDIASAVAALAGTPLYLAPEILASGHASPASDVYSLGVLLFHLLTGKYPVHAESVEALRAAHQARRRLKLGDAAPKVPVSLARIVERALEADPASRYASAAAMEQALRQFAGPPAAPARATWRSWSAVTLIALAVVALVATIWRPRPSAPVVPALTSIAVLPLTYVSGRTDAPYLADGLTDELITTLGQVAALRVTAHTSVLRFRDTRQPVAAVAAALGVGSVLEGTIAVQGADAKVPGDPKVRVNVRLIRAGTDVELWSDSFERPLSDLMALQADIARAVARSVRATLTRAEDTRLAGSAQANGPAQRAYLEGISYLRQNRHGSELRPAQDAFQQAIALDPAFSAAHAALAQTYVRLADDEEIPQPDAYAAAVAAARRALVLDPNRADAHVALADLSFRYDWDWSGAEASYLEAIALDGSDADARTHYARLLAARGRVDAARQQAEAAVAIDPLSADVKLTEGLMAYYQRRYGEAEGIMRLVLRMDPRFPAGYFVLGRINEAQNRLVDATNMVERAVRLTDAPHWRAEGVRLRALAGDRAAARAGLTDLNAQLAGEHRTLEPPYEAYVRLALGERDAALRLLSEAVSDRNPNVLWMAVDPRLDPLRDDTRFQALVVRLGRP